MNPGTNKDILYMSVSDGAKPVIFLQTRYDEGTPQISPQGDYLAYISNESGVWDVYVKPFPEGEGKWQISTKGGVHPRWAQSGKAIYYVHENQLMVAAVDTRPTFRMISSRELFEGSAVQTKLFTGDNPFNSFYDVTPDDKHFIIIQNDYSNEKIAKIVVSLNMFEKFLK
jgi:hypothetical protein